MIPKFAQSLPSAEGEFRNRHTRTASPLSDMDAAALFSDLADSRGLIVAVSGGPDSTALLVLLARWHAQLAQPPELLAVTVDHGLRKKSRAEANAVKRLARELDVPHKTVHWRGAKPAAGLQEAARMARYHLLARAALASGADRVLTAHTRDDQAETVLFRMARGSGLSGLGGMARSARLPACGLAVQPIVLVRPFLHIPKTRLIATLRAHGIAFADDPSNRDPRFTRTRLRGMMPVLAAEGLDAERFDVLAHRLRRADQALDHTTKVLVERLFRGPAPGQSLVAIDWPALRECPEELSLRALRHAIERAGLDGTAELRKLEALWTALQEAGQAGRRLRRTLAGAVVTLTGQVLTVERAPPRRPRTLLTPR